MIAGSDSKSTKQSKTNKDLRTISVCTLMLQQVMRTFFNYGLNTQTWRNLVNKQIMQVYTRLLIEKQLNEVKRQEKLLKD